MSLVAGAASCGGSETTGSSQPIPPKTLPPDIPPTLDCAGPECLQCASGDVGCANATTLLPGTCCAEGDALVHLATGSGAEAVDIESDGEHAVLCGGFGARINDVTNPANPASVGAAGPRCQRAAIGPGGDGDKIFYITHHGDSWVPGAFLGTYVITPNGIEERNLLSEAGVLYEGLDWHDGTLYVAAHDEGVRVYQTAADGTPTYVTTVGGMQNAWQVEIHDGFAFVVDNDVGVHVMTLDDPQAPVLELTIETTERPRDLDVHDGRLYVALGSFGIDVFDVTEPLDPVPVGNIETLGSAQSVSADGDVLAVAAWSHVAIYETASLNLITTEQLRPYPSFEQDLGVTVHGKHLYVAEWEGMHALEYRPGFIAPDLWVDESQLSFEPDLPAGRAVVVRNRGHLPLEISDMQTNDAAFLVTGDAMNIAPGEADFFEVIFQPPPPIGFKLLTLFTNDPDVVDVQHQLGLVASSSNLLTVGDPLTDAFAFLDPNGNASLTGLEGKVTVLSYFALF